MSYHAGDRVRVSIRAHPGHHRTPVYLKGRTGTIDRVHGSFKNPETRAYGEDGLPVRPLYSVCFAQPDLWCNYHGRSDDRLYVDLYEHWLESADE
jgi:nitrile hydratase